jgi:hypothetical protein
VNEEDSVMHKGITLKQFIEQQRLLLVGLCHLARYQNLLSGLQLEF